MADEHIVAGILTAVHSEYDPHFGELMEVVLTYATKRTLDQGVSVWDSEALLARKAAAQHWCIESRDAGQSLKDILEAAKGAPWEIP